MNRNATPNPSADSARLGPVTIEAPFFQAGLAGYSDVAMRRVARAHGCPFCVTEAMLDIFLLNGGKRLAEAELDADDHPIAGQLMGSHAKDIAAASKILVSMGYDVIDINLACPVKKIRKKARGGHLLSEPEEAIGILDAVKQAVGDVPCTVKLRRGTDDSPEAEANFHQIFTAVLELGYAGSTVHGRTVDQKYVGPSRWQFLTDLVKRYGLETDDPSRPNFLLGGSGDIFCAQDVADMLSETGVGWVSVARGCIGNPWIFRQTRALLANDPETAQRAPTIDEQRQVLYDHFRYSLAAHGEHRASLMMRKFGIKFAQHHPLGDQVKQAFIAVKSLGQWEQVLSDWYQEGKNPALLPVKGDFAIRA